LVKAREIGELIGDLAIRAAMRHATRATRLALTLRPLFKNPRHDQSHGRCVDGIA
jgi:hypothetical protein